MKQIYYVVILIAMLMSQCTTAKAINSNKDRIITTDTIDFKSFEGIDLQTVHRVTLHIAPYYRIIYQEEAKDPNTVNIRNNILYMSYTNSSNTISGKQFLRNTKDALKCDIYAPSFSKIYAGIACNIESTDTIKSALLTIETESAAKINLLVISEALKIYTSSASNVKLKGKSQTLRIEGSSVSNLNLLGFSTDQGDIELSSAASLKGLLIKENAKIEVSSASKATVYLLEDGQLEASSAAQIKYQAPQAVYSEHSSLGSVSYTYMSKEDILDAVSYHGITVTVTTTRTIGNKTTTMTNKSTF